jgi:hypothetical protein
LNNEIKKLDAAGKKKLIQQLSSQLAEAAQ